MGSSTTTASKRSRQDTSSSRRSNETSPSTRVPTRTTPDNSYDHYVEICEVSRAQLLDERAARLSTQYGLETSDWDWHVVETHDTVLRTDKSTRMRVRWDCHRCQAPIAQNKRCTACEHSRCSKCLRYPPERSTAEAKASRRDRCEAAQQPAIVADYHWDDSEMVLTRPSKTGGQDLIHKTTRQRVRRTCHVCGDSFPLGIKICETCDHTRCSDCPRDPCNKEKYPFGYPGDEFGPNSVPYYECARCHHLYPQDAEDGTPCQKCNCVKSASSPRSKPRAVEQKPDPNVLKLIKSKLDALK